MFASNANTIRNFIVQSICSIRNVRTLEHLLQNVTDEIIGLVKGSEELVSKFTTACLQAFNGGHQQLKSFYFHLLGRSAILAPCGKEIHIYMDTLRLKQIKEAYRKLYGTTETYESDLSRWRLGLCQEPFSVGNESERHAVRPFRTIDHLFSSEK